MSIFLLFVAKSTKANTKFEQCCFIQRAVVMIYFIITESKMTKYDLNRFTGALQREPRIVKSEYCLLVCKLVTRLV